MTRYQVNLREYATNATLPIDNVFKRDDYTAEDYIKDCKENADIIFIKMLEVGEVSLGVIDD